MPKAPTRQFVPKDNVHVMNAVRNNASTAFQARIPEVTKANIQQTAMELLSYPDHRNEFVSALVNRIGFEIIAHTEFENPLAKFKRSALMFGDSVEEIQIGLAKAYTYDDTREYLEKAIYGREDPDVQASIHRINRQEWYKISISDTLLRRAFTSDYGLSNMVSSLMAVPVNSDNWDEFLLTTSLFKLYDDNEGFFKVNVPDITAPTAGEDEAKATLKAIRSMADTLPFVSTHYNASGMPVATSRDKLHLFITPEAKATLDVDALASVFNIDRADFNLKHTVIPSEQMDILGCQAILTTEDFFVILDSLYEMRQAQNPVGLFDNHFLHHHQIISFSRFVPAVMFTTEAGTVIGQEEFEVTGISDVILKDDNKNVITEVTRGNIHQILAHAVTTPEGGANDGVRLEVFTPDGKPTSAMTKITNSGAFIVGYDELATTLDVHITAIDNEEVTKVVSFDVVGDAVQLWPDKQVIDEGDLAPEPEDPTP